ncbi:MAG TPA: alpha/beta hydrolase, partial [Tepidiformaceae bacterium]|nr:alpha/beta hydrolase [Tepidiformaceae bacterium]
FVPHGRGPFPAVVLVHGSSPGERGFYQLYAHHFARQGVAALAYDRRGSGASGGGVESTLELRARDAAAAIEFLRGQAGIDPRSVGLWAFSNGTWSAPMVAAHMTPVAFMVVTGAAGVSGAESETHRKLTELRGWGIGPGILRDVQTAWRTAYACIAGGYWPADVAPAEYDALIERLHSEPALAAVPLASYAIENPWLAPIPPNVAAAELQRNAGRVPDLAYDPLDDYARITCPVLFFIGEDDPNCPATGAALVRDVLARAGNTRSTVEVVPGAGHYINITPAEIEGMARAEAASELHGLRFAAGYLERMAAWVSGAARG